MRHIESVKNRNIVKYQQGLATCVWNVCLLNSSEILL